MVRDSARYRKRAGEALTALCLFFILSTILSRPLDLTFDEGIYLQGASLVAEGQVPYRDFRAITGPGSFWIGGAVGRAFGSNFHSVRQILALDLTVLSFLLYKCVSGAVGTNVGRGCAISFLLIVFGASTKLYLNHRWDSAAFFWASIVILSSTLETPDRRRLILAGFLAGVTVVVTPPMLLAVALIVLAIGFLIPGYAALKSTALFAVGFAAATAVSLGTLLISTPYSSVLEAIRWVLTHYPGVNSTPYGYGSFFPLESIVGMDPASAGLITRDVVQTACYLVICLVFPANLLLFFNLVRCRFPRRFFGSPGLHLTDAQYRLAWLLMAASAGSVLSTLPRWSADELTFAFAPNAAVLAIFLAWSLWESCRGVIAFVTTAFSTACLTALFLSVLSLKAVTTPRGTVWCNADLAAALRTTTTLIHPGSNLYVYPYMPLLYFLTAARNPTEYLYLQPGMMDDSDEIRALQELTHRPPEWVIWCDAPEQLYKSIWPGTSTVHFAKIERFIRSNYIEVSAAGVDRMVIRFYRTRPN